MKLRRQVISYQVFATGEDLFDGIEVGAVWRQEDEMGAPETL